MLRTSFQALRAVDSLDVHGHERGLFDALNLTEEGLPSVHTRIRADDRARLRCDACLLEGRPRTTDEPRAFMRAVEACPAKVIFAREFSVAANGPPFQTPT